MLLQNEILGLINEAMSQTARLRLNGNEAVYFCPFCNHYKPKLEVCLNTADQSFGNWHCWVCNARGKTIYSLFKKLNVPKNILKKSSELLSIKKPKRSSFDEEFEIAELPPEFIPLTLKKDSIMYRHVRHYLLKIRKLEEMDIIRYNIGYCEHGKYSGYVVVPSYDQHGKLNYFSARSIYNGFLKYKNSPSSKDIVGFELFLNYNKPITLTEGVFDAIAIKNNSVPLFGLTMSNALKNAIAYNKVSRVNVALDGEALKEALKIVDVLQNIQHHIDIRLVELPNEKDPSVIGFKEIQKFIEDARPLSRDDFKNKIFCQLNYGS